MLRVHMGLYPEALANFLPDPGGDGSAKFKNPKSFCIAKMCWGGLYPSIEDYRPVVEEREPRLFTAAGFSGTGLMHAQAAGLIIRDLVKFGKSEKINLAAFSSQRFETLKSVSEKTGF